MREGGYGGGITNNGNRRGDIETVADRCTQSIMINRAAAQAGATDTRNRSRSCSQIAKVTSTRVAAIVRAWV